MEKKTIRISEKRQITIPINFFNQLGFTTQAECFLRGNEIVIKPLRESSESELYEQILADLIAHGLSGEELLNEFRAAQKRIRPAVENMLRQAELAAEDKVESYSYEDVFSEE